MSNIVTIDSVRRPFYFDERLFKSDGHRTLTRPTEASKPKGCTVVPKAFPSAFLVEDAMGPSQIVCRHGVFMEGRKGFCQGFVASIVSGLAGFVGVLYRRT